MRKLPETEQNKPGRHWREPGFLLPGVEAILIQAIAFFILYLSLLVLERAFHHQISIGGAALLLGALAAGITWFRRLPLWWVPIQFFFPIAMIFAYAMAFSPVLYLGLFFLFLIIYWTPFKTRVPLYLSGKPVWEKVAEFIPVDTPVRVVDIGSGLGGLVLYLADRFPHARVTGIELAPFPWFVGWFRGRTLNSRATFCFGDYANFDFSQFDVVFAFLSPAAMPSLWEKAASDMQQGSLLLSYEFIIPDVKPDIVIQVDKRGAALYGWHISENIKSESNMSEA